MLSLTIINSDNICNSFALDTTPGVAYRIGRSADCEISLPEEMHLSRVHCILTIGEGCALLTDNNSSNGIFEDDARVAELLMLPGKTYRAGNCRLMLEYTADEQPVEETYGAEQPDEAQVYYEETTEGNQHEEEPYYAEQVVEPEPYYEETADETQTADVQTYSEPVASEPQPVTQQAEAPEPIEENVVSTTISPEPEPEIVPEATPQIIESAPSAPAPKPAPRRKFVPPPPRKALVKRAAPRPFYTAAGKLNTETSQARPKALKHRRSTNGVKTQRPPSVSAESLGLPNDFDLNIRLLNTTPTLEEGDLLKFGVKASEKCYIYLIQYDSNRQAMMLVPGVAGADNTVSKGGETQFPPQGADSKYELYVEPPFGKDTILAIACTHPCNFEKLWATCSAEADALTTLGEVERNTIQLCREESDIADARWAAAMLCIETGA